MILQVLKESTLPAHQRLEGHPWLQQLMSDDLTLEHYIKVLRCFSLYYDALETTWAPYLQESDYNYQLRGPLLKQDLSDLTTEEPMPKQTSALPDPPPDLSSFAGMLYVVEGSSQGGRVIGPRLQRKLRVNRLFGARFFNIHQLAPNSWPEYCHWIEKNEQIMENAAIVSGANQIFSTLYESLNRSQFLGHKQRRMSSHRNLYGE